MVRPLKKVGGGVKTLPLETTFNGAFKSLYGGGGRGGLARIDIILQFLF